MTLCASFPSWNQQSRPDVHEGKDVLTGSHEERDGSLSNFTIQGRMTGVTEERPMLTTMAVSF